MNFFRRSALVAAAALSALTLSACGDSYDRDEAIADFEEAGMTNEQAICLVDRLEAEMGVDRLNETGDLTAEEEELISTASVECVLGS